MFGYDILTGNCLMAYPFLHDTPATSCVFLPDHDLLITTAMDTCASVSRRHTRACRTCPRPYAHCRRLLQQKRAAVVLLSNVPTLLAPLRCWVSVLVAWAQPCAPGPVPGPPEP